jgi:hypothetical protein
MTLPMIIMICVGCALIIAALVYLGMKVYRLAKTAMAAQKELEAEVQVLLQKQQVAMDGVAHFQAQQAVLMANVERLQAAFARLGFLMDQFSRARTGLADLMRIR